MDILPGQGLHTEKDMRVRLHDACIHVWQQPAVSEIAIAYKAGALCVESRSEPRLGLDRRVCLEQKSLALVTALLAPSAEDEIAEFLTHLGEVFSVLGHLIDKLGEQSIRLRRGELAGVEKMELHLLFHPDVLLVASEAFAGRLVLV